MHKLPANTRLPPDFARGLYDPQFIPTELKLNEFVEDPEARQREVRQSVQKKVGGLLTPDPATGPTTQAGPTEPGIPQPLTEEEAEEVDRYIDALRDRIAKTQARISTMRAFIDESANPVGGKELSFSLDISKKGSIKRAVKKVFGRKTDTITYSMYKSALELKRQIEEEESDSYVNGTEDE